jgi:hypothetical protein
MTYSQAEVSYPQSYPQEKHWRVGHLQHFAQPGSVSEYPEDKDTYAY